MDMHMGRLEANIRRVHEEYSTEIRNKLHDPASEAEFTDEVFRIILTYRMMGTTFPDDATELGPIMDRLCHIGCSFSDADNIARRLDNSITFLEQEYFNKGLECNDLEFIKRYADAPGIVGYICDGFKEIYDSRDAELLEKQENNRKENKRYLNRQSVQFGLLMFALSWCLTADRCGKWWALVVALVLGLFAAWSIGAGLRYSEKSESIQEKIEWFWNGAAITLIILVGILIIRYVK